MEEGDTLHYDLTGAANSDSQKVVILVKLTDSALRALQQCARRAKGGGALRIKFGDLNGPVVENELFVPTDNAAVSSSTAAVQKRSDGNKLGLVRSLSDDSDDEIKQRKPRWNAEPQKLAGSEFERFTFSLDRETGGCVECVERRRQIWRLVGAIEWRAQIHANADVYDAARERIDECEREARKPRTRTLDAEATNSKTTRIVIKKPMATVLKKPIAALPPAPQSRIAASAALHTSSVATSNPASIATSGSKLNSRNGLNDQLASKSQPIKQTVSVRERVLHVLALNTFTKSELILKLQSVGGAMSKLSPLRDDEKVQIGIALNELGEPRRRRRGATTTTSDDDCVYALKRDFFAEVNADWPFYDANERVIVRERKRTAASGIDESVAKKTESTKQSSSVTVPSKRNDADDDRPRQLERQSDVSVGKKPRIETQSDARPLNEEDFKQQFIAINSDNQRARYKQAFEAGYDELQRVLATILPVSEMFRAFDVELQSVKPNSARYKELHAQIVATYQKYTRDEEYMRTRQRAQYLHAKLRHIKSLIADYDAKRAPCAT